MLQIGQRREPRFKGIEVWLHDTLEYATITSYLNQCTLRMAPYRLQAVAHTDFRAETGKDGDEEWTAELFIAEESQGYHALKRIKFNPALKFIDLKSIRISDETCDMIVQGDKVVYAGNDSLGIADMRSGKDRQIMRTEPGLKKLVIDDGIHIEYVRPEFVKTHVDRWFGNTDEYRMLVMGRERIDDHLHRAGIDVERVVEEQVDYDRQGLCEIVEYSGLSSRLRGMYR